jgi:DNA-binding SARP family transcriptional activator/tetratricopeptide (TPR) repeat protein
VTVSVTQDRPRVRAFWARASGRCGGTDINLDGFLRNANFSKGTVMAVELSLALLGPPVVRRDGAPVTFDTRKATALLALLAVTGREHTREQLADLLWPEADSAKGRASLRRTLSVTAAAMGDGLVISRAAVALDPAAVRVDVTEFGTLIGQPDAASLERAVALYRSDFLAGFTLRDCPEFEEWQATVSEELRQALARGLQRLVAACIADGALERAAGHARRWLELDPLHEPAHQAIIRLHGWGGERSAAMRQYRSLVRVLDRELAVRPLPETTRLYDDVRAGRLGPPPVPVAAPAQVAAPASAAAPVTVAASASASAEPSAGAFAGALAGALAGAWAGAAEAAGAWPLVGRERELAALRAAWRAAGRGGRVVAIAGQAGSGKTRLITELRDEAAGAGATVLAARCHDGETGLPFVLAADLLRTALAVRPGLPGTLPAQTAAMAGRLVPALAAGLPAAGPAGSAAPPLDSPMAVTRLYAAIADILRAAADPGPDGTGAGIVVVEDLQWADSSSLGLLAYLVRRLADGPLLLVLSWQPEQDGRLRVLRTALAEAESQSAGETIEPGPLGPAAIGTLLGLDGMPAIEVDRLMAETRGLPMLVREYVEAFRAQPLVGSQPSGSELAGRGPADWWPPASVRDLFMTRLQTVSEPARQMLTAAAVLGSDNDADLLRAVSGRGEDEIVEAIDEALGRSLLTEIAPPVPEQAPSYGFPYEALRQTAYESATLARRRLLHGRAADALTRRHERDPATTRAATVAGHLQRAGRDGEAAQWWWRAAAAARELYAHAEAHAHLTRALALGYPELPGRIALAEVLVVLGRYREALAELETAAAIAAEAGPDAHGGPDAPGEADQQAMLTQAGVEHKLADVHHRLGDWDLAEAHLAVVTELVEGTEPGLLARVLADRAVVAYRRGAAGQATELGRAALASAQAAADAGATAQALNVLGMLAARAGSVAEAEQYLRDGLAEARRQREPGATVAALNNLARLLAETGRGGEALDAAAEALDLGRELGDQHRVAALHTNLADLLHADGQRDAAMTHLKEAARRFAAVDGGDVPRPEIWTLVEW